MTAPEPVVDPAPEPAPAPAPEPVPAPAPVLLDEVVAVPVPEAVADLVPTGSVTVELPAPEAPVQVVATVAVPAPGVVEVGVVVSGGGRHVADALEDLRAGLADVAGPVDAATAGDAAVDAAPHVPRHLTG